MKDEMNLPSPLLMLMRQPPYASRNPLEALDVALVAAAFDFRVSLLFEGAGVWQLVKTQDGSALQTRTQGEALAQLPRFGIDSYYVCADSLAAADLDLRELLLPAKPLTRPEMRALIAAHTLVVND